MTEVVYTMPNISCQHCTHTIEMELGEVEGVKSVAASLEAKQVKIVFEPPANENILKELLIDINYPVAE
jgi:copper chaperone